MVDCLPQYRVVSTHGRNALRGILAIGTGRWITCAALYKKLCTSKCDWCGAQGGYLYLVTCKRACFWCLSLNRFCHPLPLDTAASTFKLDASTLYTLPHMTALPGTYSPGETVTEPIVLFDFKSAEDAGNRIHKGYEGMLAHRDISCCSRLVALGLERGFIAKDAKSASFAAASRVPWFNNKTRKFEDLFFCEECLQHPMDSYGIKQPSWRLQYTRESLVNHWTTCRFQGLRLRSGAVIQRR